MSRLETEVERLEPRPLPGNIQSVQPGGGSVMRLELAWGRCRRWLLRLLRPGYVKRMKAVRRGDCPGCPHDIIDARDLKFYRNVCGYSFPPDQDRFGWRDHLGVARIGLAEIMILGTPLLALSVIAVIWMRALAIIPAGLLVFVVAFFRDPKRRIPDQPGALVAPADGKVDDIEQIEYCEALGGPAQKVGIFLSVFNVHLNRVPERSRVIELRYIPGLFGNAMRRSAARENEQLWMLLESDAPPYRRMLVKQIAGAVARRIVCHVRPGEVLERGQIYGMIKFGSRTELYLPKEERLCLTVQLNQMVRGGSNVIARYTDSE